MYSVVGNDGQVYGPVDMATLRQWIAEGRIVATTELVDPLDGSRLPAGMAPALMSLFPDEGAYPRPAPYGAATPYGGYPRPDTMPAYAAGPPKSRLAAIVLAVFLGWLGIHRFYLGQVGLGVGMLVLFLAGFPTCFASWIALGIWVLVDVILIASGTVRDSTNQPLGP